MASYADEEASALGRRVLREAADGDALGASVRTGQLIAKILTAVEIKAARY